MHLLTLCTCYVSRMLFMLRCAATSEPAADGPVEAHGNLTVHRQTWFSQGIPGYPSSKLKNSTEMELNEFDRVGLSFGHWHADPSTAESCMNSHRCRGFWQSQLILPRIWSTTLPSSLRQRDCWFEKFTFARLAQLYGLRSVASRVSCCNTANSFSLQGPCWSD